MRFYLRFMLFMLFLGSAMLVKAELPNPTRFSWLVEKGDIKAVQQWFNEGLNPEFEGATIGTGLMIAAWNGNIEMMALFIENGANPKRANKNGEQALQLAAWNGKTEAVNWLLQHGAPLNRTGDYWGALHYAVFNGHLELAKSLVQQGANVNARAPNGATPLIVAAREGREEAVKFLVEQGANTKAATDWGDTALNMALRYDHYNLGKLVATQEEFDAAIKLPKENYGNAQRSFSPPAKLEGLLRDLFEAEALGNPTTELKKKLQQEINGANFTSGRVVQSAKEARRPAPVPYQPRSMVITAKRGNPSQERAVIVTKPTNSAEKQAKIGALMRQIRSEKAAGRPTEKLQKELDGLLGGK